jgi:two-component sensor histidine kinase
MISDRCVKMLKRIRILQGAERPLHMLPMWLRVVLTSAALGVTFLFQIPLEREVPGEPFLLFFLVVICATLAFGRPAGLFAVGLSAFLSFFFFEPFGSLAILHAADVIKVELYAVLAGACVVGFAALAKALQSANETTEALQRREASKSILLRELAHGVANNFAAVAALMSMKSAAVRDREAKSVLDEAIEQVTIMARMHRRLRTGSQGVWLDGGAFIRELCDDLGASTARGRPLSIACKADDVALGMDQAVLLGLIANELVTNAIKHAFPDGRAGHIDISFEACEDHLQLSVQDDGIGLPLAAKSATGMGRTLVQELVNQLGGRLDVSSGKGGSSFRVFVPCERPLQKLAPHQPAPLIH